MHSVISDNISAPRRFAGPRCKDLKRELEAGLLLLTGGRDKRGGAVITFPQSCRREKARSEDYLRMLEYLTSLPG